MTTRKILYLPETGLSRDILSEGARATLSSLGDVTWNEMDRNYTPDEITALLPGVDAVVTSWGVPGFTEEMLAAADNLKIVGHAAGSVKHVMPKSGYDRGIVVLSAAAVIADAVAEYTLWAMLSMQRDIYRHDVAMKTERGWTYGDKGFAHELYHKRVGIVSAGLIGRRMFKLLAPFHCDVLLYDPYRQRGGGCQLGVRKVSLDAALRDGRHRLDPRSDHPGDQGDDQGRTLRRHARRRALHQHRPRLDRGSSRDEVGPRHGPYPRRAGCLRQGAAPGGRPAARHGQRVPDAPHFGPHRRIPRSPGRGRGRTTSPASSPASPPSSPSPGTASRSWPDS